MQLPWQDVIALGIVMLALLHLARRFWLTFVRQQSSGCGSCSGCPTKSAPSQLHTIDLNYSPSSHQVGMRK